MSSSNSHHDDLSTSFSSSKEASRKLCVRHKQMANQNVNAKLQKVSCGRPRTRVAASLTLQSLDSLPVPERAAITSLWSTFSAAPDSKRKIILEGILTMCCL
jgi:F-box/WD-40 domain protein MET30